MQANPLAQLFSNLLIVGYQEIAHFSSTERCLERIDIITLQLVPHGNTGSPFLLLLHGIGAVVVTEGWVQFRHQEGELLWFCVRGVAIIAFRVAAIEEHVFLAGVPVQVDEHYYLFLLCQLSDFLLEVEDLGMHLGSA